MIETFLSDDNKPFPSPEARASYEARRELQRRHQALRDKRDNFNQAARDLFAALLESALTADGKWFDASTPQSYFLVLDGLENALPTVQEVFLSPHHLRVEEDQGNGTLIVLDTRCGGYHRVSELFVSQDAADRVCLARKKERHAKMGLEISTEIKMQDVPVTTNFHLEYQTPPLDDIPF